ncbi:MAG: growth inhibitor PemK [Alphaproteobacteria bacterium]|nr:growth inhibitor PemK [Alphaproteobacteria bacterium]
MPLPEPVPGLVISYAYLWRHEHEQGREEGRKVRPAVIVLAAGRGGNENGDIEVYVAPITHTPPPAPDIAVEIPLRVKQRLQLDDDRSWVIVNEVNRFIWPGVDPSPAPATPGSAAYGMLPPALFRQIRDLFVRLARSGRAASVRRTE